MQIALFDTTLRDGTQSEGLSLSVEDKIKIARLLDGFGVRYIEGGYPGANPKDEEFFRRASELKLKQARLTAFGSTRRTGSTAATDSNLQALVKAGTPAVAIFGKTWLLHVTDVLKTTPEDNLAMIADSVSFLKQNGREVIFDAEHFFDGFRADRDYALAAVQAAARAGADWIVFCDTNGGNLPSTVAGIVREANKALSAPLGIHAHNDSDLAVANSLAAVEAGCTMVHGTINGWGERCGNANLMSVIPALQLKMGLSCIPEENMERLTEVSRTASEIANLRPRAHAPYVGASAFAHKAGAHVAAVAKSPVTFEHIPPEMVGNDRRIVVSELSGRGNIRVRAAELGVELRGNEADLVARIKELENQGYQFEAADGSLELMLRRTQPGYSEPFEVLDVVVISQRRSSSDMFVEATVKLKVGDEISHVVAEGSGPVDAMDHAFHKALDQHFPILRQIHLCDFKVRILDPESATAAITRVLVESSLGSDRWSTIGVSQNIIEASCEALKDALELPLVRAAKT
ncbi:MAG: citramalate synthase [Polyangia bacterium]|jgi:2-isopropylmalate synthase